VFITLPQALIIMSKPRDHPDPSIPAVFVSEKAGIIMRKLITPGQTRVRIVPVSRCTSHIFLSFVDGCCCLFAAV
jgi:E3 ubiquitin-protein ligase RNF13